MAPPATTSARKFPSSTVSQAIRAKTARSPPRRTPLAGFFHRLSTGLRARADRACGRYERQMGKSLREVADLSPKSGLIFLSQKAQRISQRKKLLKKRFRLIDPF